MFCGYPAPGFIKGPLSSGREGRGVVARRTAQERSIPFCSMQHINVSRIMANSNIFCEIITHFLVPVSKKCLSSPSVPRGVTLCRDNPFFEFVSSSDSSVCIFEFVLSVSEHASGIYCMDTVGRIRFIPLFRVHIRANGGIFFGISFVLGLTKAVFGCRLYDIGSIWSRCSPQSIQVDDGILTGAFGCRSEEKSKNLRESV